MSDLSRFLRPAFVERIYSHYEATSTDWRRPHLGASLLGNPCQRSLWLSFRWAVAPEFSGRVLRLFDTGNREEGRIVRDLRNAGITVFDADPATKKQFHVTISPHCGGSLDGIGQGFDEAPKKWHVLEFKTHGQKSFDELEQKGVEEAKPLHYAQMQTYMSEMNKLYPDEFDRAMYVGVNKNTDGIYPERVKLDHLFAQQTKGKALTVIDSPNIPPAISDNEKHPDCLFCPQHGVCFGNQWKEVSGKWQMVPFSRDKLEVNCRTCLHSTPLNEIGKDGNGAWHCAKDDSFITPEGMRARCSDHLFVPGLLVGWSVEDASPAGEWVKYDKGINKAGGVIE